MYLKALSFFIFVFSLTAHANVLQCDVVNDSGAKTGTLESDRFTHETKYTPTGGKSEIIDDEKTVCGIPVNKVDQERSVSDFFQEDPFGFVLMYNRNFTAVNNGSPFPLYYEFLFASLIDGTGHFRCKETDDYSFEKGPQFPHYDLNLRNCDFKDGSAGLNCFDNMLEHFPQLSRGVDCLYKAASNEMKQFCGDDGLARTSKFNQYIKFKKEFEIVDKARKDYEKENPGSSSLPPRIAGRVANAQVAWDNQGFGKELRRVMEDIRRKSSGICPMTR